MSLAVQAALAAGEKRLYVTLPVGMRFGIFGAAGKQTIGAPNVKPTIAEVQRAEFELAFLCAEIFRGQCTCVVESPAAVRAAEREFASKGLQPRIVASVDKVRAKPKGGFGAPAAASVEQGRVVVLLRPGSAAAKRAAPAEGGVVLLLNPRSPPASYKPVYLLQDNPHPEWEGGLLFHSFAGDWSLAAAGFGGALTVHGRSPERPALEAIDRGFAAIRDDNNPFSRSVGAAAALRRRGAAEGDDA